MINSYVVTGEDRRGRPQRSPVAPKDVPYVASRSYAAVIETTNKTFPFICVVIEGNFEYLRDIVEDLQNRGFKVVSVTFVQNCPDGMPTLEDIAEVYSEGLGMSRAYRIQVSEKVSRVVHVEDGIQATLPILPILPPEVMGKLLADQLKQKGFEEGEDGVCRRLEPNGVMIEVDPKSGRVQVGIAKNIEVEVEGTSEHVAEDDRPATHQVPEEAHDRARADAERKAAGTAKQLQRQATAELEKTLGGIRKELDNAVGKATVEALKERARHIGEIESVQEDGKGNIRIEVKV
jgi:hypothetical protein